MRVSDVKVGWPKAAAIFVATLAATGVLGTTTVEPASAAVPTNSAIVADATAYPNGSVVGDGQCWTFMHDVVLQASAGSMSVGQNNDYFGSYSAVGGQLIARDSAQPGDIIQLYNPANHQDSAHVHTAIVLSHSSGSNSFGVIDANYALNLQVLRHTWDPFADAAGHPGWAVAIWRLGTVSGGASGYEVAFQANTGSLWSVGVENHGAWGLGMMPGTSPAIARLSNGGYEIAFQANTGSLWTVGDDGNTNWGLGMMAGSSPAITGLASGGFEAAFEANTTSLWTVGLGGGSDLHGAWGLGMYRGSSPAISAVGSGYEVAFEANTTSLWTVGAAGNTNWGLGMMAGTSPSIMGLSGGGFEAEFEANTTSLWSAGSQRTGSLGLGMWAGTNPSAA